MPSTSLSEPKPLGGDLRFEEADFHALSAALAGNPEGNPRRLETRRKLLALGKKVVRRAAPGTKLECRTSLHHPHAFNGMRVRRIWVYLTRPRAEKRRLKGVLGAELGKDLDSAYRNAYLCLGIEEDALEVSLRIHSDAWFDGQNLVNRVKQEGVRSWLAVLNTLGGWQLRMHDWKGEWRCGDLEGERLEEFLSYYKPGDHRLAVERRWPAPRGAREAVLAGEVPDALCDELLRMLPLYRFTAWSEDSNFLFSGG